MDSLRYASRLKEKLWKVSLHFRQHEVRKLQTKHFSSNYSTTHTNEMQQAPLKLKPPWNVLFFGTDEFAVESLVSLHRGKERGLIETLDVVTAATEKSSAVQRYCRKNNLKVIHWPIEVPLGIYDVGTVVSFGHLLPLAVINGFPWGILNVHGSLLPRWRGAAPIIHAILNNDKVTGVTVMEIQPHRFDVGRIVSTAKVPIPWDIKSKALTTQLACIGAQELISVLENLQQKIEAAKEQSSEGVTKAPKLSEKKARIKWDVYTCRQIQSMFRALDDHTPLWTTWQGTHVKLKEMTMYQEWSSEVNEDLCNDKCLPEDEHLSHYADICDKKIFKFKEHEVLNADDIKQSGERIKFQDLKNNTPEKYVNRTNCTEPGTILYSKKTRILSVMCKDNWVDFSRIFVKGRKGMTAHEFYNGFISKIPKEHHQFH